MIVAYLGPRIIQVSGIFKELGSALDSNPSDTYDYDAKKELI